MAEVLNIWSGWPRIVEIAGNAFLFYALIIVMVRMVGKRTTSELNNFDWIINVMIGSLAASGVLLRNVATADAIAAIVVLAACQYITTKLVQRSRTILQAKEGPRELDNTRITLGIPQWNRSRPKK